MKKEKNKCSFCQKTLLFKTCLIIVMTILSCILISFVFACNHWLITRLYKAMQTNYFSKRIIEPLINRNANLTQAYNIRIKLLDDILLESRLSNIKYLMKFTNDNYNHSIDIDNTFKNKNYYMKIKYPTVQHDKDNQDMFNLISKISFLFQSNLNEGIQEIILIDKTTKNYFTYCNNIEKEYLYFQELSQNDKSLQFIDNTAKKYEFADFIVNNQYQCDSYLNYLKFISFRQHFGNKATQRGPYYFLLGLRLKNNAINEMFNIQMTNMTTVLYQYSFGTIIEKQLHYVSLSDFFTSFYNYAMINIFDYNTINYHFNLDQEMTFINSQISTYFKLLSKEREEGLVYYKSNWDKTIILMSKIFYSTLQKFNALAEIDLFNKIDCDLKRNEILCEARKGIDTYSFNISIYKSNSTRVNVTDVVLKDFYQYVYSVNSLSQRVKHGNSKIVIENVFSTGKNLAPTKFLIYDQSVNNLLAVNIEIINTGFSPESNDDFIYKMNDYRAKMVWMLFASCWIILAISISIGLKELNSTIIRLNRLRRLKTDFFICKLNSKNNDKNNSEGKHTKDILRWKEENIYKNEFFEENNKTIINCAYNLLIIKLEKLNTCQYLVFLYSYIVHDQRFTEKVQFLRQKFKLSNR